MLILHSIAFWVCAVIWLVAGMISIVCVSDAGDIIGHSKNDSSVLHRIRMFVSGAIWGNSISVIAAVCLTFLKETDTHRSWYLIGLAAQALISMLLYLYSKTHPSKKTIPNLIPKSGTS